MKKRARKAAKAKTEIKKVVAYTRVSTAEQAEKDLAPGAGGRASKAR